MSGGPMTAPRGVPSAEGARPRTSDESLTMTIGRITAQAALLLGAFAVVKSYAVAHFSLTTGSALLSAAPVSVLLGSLMSYAYWGFPLAAVAAAHLGFRSCRHSGLSWEAL